MNFRLRGFLGGLYFVFFGGRAGCIQKNRKIRGSACISWLRSSANVFFPIVFIFRVISF